jgi:formylglycine-generating enzyme required for sulfatase activity
MKKNTITLLICFCVIMFAACEDTEDEEDDQIVAVEIEMVPVEGGTFQMGYNYNDSEKPAHSVTLSDFYMSKYPVTQEYYRSVMRKNPSSFSSNPESGEEQGKRPVDTVSWYEAIVFCNKLSLMEGLNPAYSIRNSTDPSKWGDVPGNENDIWDAAQIVSGSNGYRLPTEAQWEYAAKGGNQNAAGWKNYTYSGSSTIGNVAWYSGNSNYITHEVGKKEPNSLDLYDMSGNVYEWCWDWYDNYSSEPQTDPTGPDNWPTLRARVKRGGSYLFEAASARSAARIYGYPSQGGDLKPGFRLVRPWTEQPEP